MRTLSTTYLIENMSRVLDELSDHPDGIIITRYGRGVARMVAEEPTEREPRAERPPATPQRAAEAILSTLQRSPGVDLPWKAVRPAHRLRHGVETAKILDVLRETPGVQVSPIPGRAGWTLRYDDLL